ncbi:MAG: choice-of-anchor B family protein, partial [Flavobacteriales bacterium]|nr:choice-of-anchor B family protein [Flavobacteriales bacterium]
DEQQSGVNTRTYFFNVEDLNNPFLAGTYTATTSAIDHNLYIKDGIAYQSNYRAGLRLLDVSNAPNAEEVGFFDLYPSSDAASFNGTWSNYPYFASGVVAVSHIEEGLFLLMPDLPEPCTESCGCTDATACNYDASASNDDGSCDFSCYGCTNSEACNYDATATIDNGSCFLPDPGFGCECSSDGAINATLSGTQLSEPFTFEGTGNPVAGVFDLTLNFAGSGGAWPGDMAVTVTDPNGQCVSFGGYNSTPAGCTSLGGYQQIWPSDWTNSIDGTYTASLDLSSAGLTSAGTWSVALYNGWSTGPSVTYDASFTLNDVCTVQNGTPGCTLLEACNYDSEATVDDGSCILPYSEVYIDEDGDGIGGNMAIADACDPLPANWVLETGDCDDSNSSIYPGAPGAGLGVDNNCDGVVSGDEVNACPQDLNNDGSVTVADVLLILGEFGCTIGCAADVDGDGAVSVG